MIIGIRIWLNKKDKKEYNKIKKITQTMYISHSVNFGNMI